MGFCKIEAKVIYKKRIVSIIYIKIENDMEKILLRMDAMSKEQNAKVDSIKWFIVSAMALLGLIMAVFKFFI